MREEGNKRGWGLKELFFAGKGDEREEREPRKCVKRG